jgi:branched-chain amino acid transport system ATP-binding protein
MTVLLEVRSFCAGYGNIAVLQDMQLHVRDSEIVTVIGPNGAGKSTMLNAIIGALPAAGSITFGGQQMISMDVETRVVLGLSLVPERRELFGPMSVEDNLRLGGWLHRGRRAGAGTGLDDIFVLFPRLKERRRQAASTLSGGERQMLAIGRALMARPKLLMLDEPSLGLAPRIVAEVLGIIANLRERGVSVLLIEQNARAALSIADRGYVLELGRIALEGPAAMLAADERMTRLYLGQAKLKPVGRSSHAA